MNKLLALTALFLAFFIASASAISVSSVQSDKFSPGEEGRITIEIENTLNSDVESVSLELIFTDLPFIPVGSSTKTEEEIEEGDEESYGFTVRASNDISPGDYKIPYEIRYYENDDLFTKKGTIGVTVEADSEISFSVETENPVVGKEGQITLKVVNRGFADAKFVLVKISPIGFTLLSENEVYIGNVDSDDFETATFDVIFNEKQPVLSAIVEYRDFNNNKITESVNIPVEVYSVEKATELGIIQPNYTLYYVLGAVLLIVIWFVWRSIKKRRRMKKSMRA